MIRNKQIHVCIINYTFRKLASGILRQDKSTFNTSEEYFQIDLLEECNILVSLTKPLPK